MTVVAIIAAVGGCVGSGVAMIALFLTIYDGTKWKRALLYAALVLLGIFACVYGILLMMALSAASMTSNR